MSCQPSTDSFGIHLLGFKCSWWHLWQANDAGASERSILSKKHDYNCFFSVAVNMLVPICWDLHVHGGRKSQTDRHTHARTHAHTLTGLLLFFLRCGEHVGTYILGPTCAWWQKITDRQTDTHTHARTHAHTHTHTHTHRTSGTYKEKHVRVL